MSFAYPSRQIKPQQTINVHCDFEQHRVMKSIRQTGGQRAFAAAMQLLFRCARLGTPYDIEPWLMEEIAEQYQLTSQALTQVFVDCGLVEEGGRALRGVEPAGDGWIIDSLVLAAGDEVAHA